MNISGNDDCFEYENDVLQYFQWRIEVLIANERSHNHNINEKIKSVRKGRKNDSVVDCTDTTTRNDDTKNTGSQSAVLPTSALIEKYKKVYNFLKTELDFLKPLDQLMSTENKNISDCIQEPACLVLWKQYRPLKPVVKVQEALPVPVQEVPALETTIESDNNVEESSPVILNDIQDNISITDTPESPSATRKRKAAGQLLVSRKSVKVGITKTPKTPKRRKVETTDVAGISTPPAEEVVTPAQTEEMDMPATPQVADVTNKTKQVKTTLSNLDVVPVEVKKTVQKAQKVADAAQRKAEKLELKMLKATLTVGAREEKLREKLAKLKDKLKKSGEAKLAKQQKLKEDKKKKQEAKKIKLAKNKKSYDKWEDRYKQLCEFYEKYGHCKVTRQVRDENGEIDLNIRSLGEWVSDQRKYFRQKKSKLLTPERIDMMNNIRFMWNPETYQKTFQMRVEECKKFKALYGHLTIPSYDALVDGKYPTEDEKRFRLWAQSIRHQYKRRVVQHINNKLDKAKIKALDDIGFDWGDTTTGTVELGTVVNKDRFLDRVNQLRAVHDQCGTCNDRKSVEKVFPNDESLYLWIKTQRKKYNKFLRGEPVPSLSAERQKMLRDVDFDFNPRHEKGSNNKNADTSEQYSPIPVREVDQFVHTTPGSRVTFNETRNQEHHYNESYYR
jgi:Helicase associated domain